MSLAFLVTALVVVATPGTGALYTIATGLSRGPRASILAAFACTLGIVPHLLAAITGLAALLHASGLAFAALKYAGVAYLLWMAWTTWRDRHEPFADATASVSTGTGPSRRQVIASGITLNLLNPKLTIFFFAFLPQFVPTNSPHATLRMVVLSAVFMAMTFVVFAAYGVAAGAIRRRVLGSVAVMRRLKASFAAGYALIATRLAVEPR